MIGRETSWAEVELAVQDVVRVEEHRNNLFTG